MADQQPRTPTTGQVRDGYSRRPPGHAVLKSRERQAAEFDRWYQAEVAAAEQRGAVKAWRNGYVHGVHDERLNQANGGGSEPSRLNPYVTDQKEGDDE